MRGERFGAGGGTVNVPAGITHAVRVLRHRGVDRPAVLAASPAYANNPYTELLLGGCWDVGVAPVAIQHLKDVHHLSIAQALGADVLLNVHWTNQLQATDRDETIAAHARFRDTVERLDLPVTWTLHNRLPHECAHPDLEIELRRWLADRAKVVHVMGEQTADAVADLYPLDPARTVVVPHPSYQGVYPDTVHRDQARWELGLHPDEGVLLLFGGIRPYKNVPFALDALDELLARGRRVRVVVAGMLVGHWEGRSDLQQTLMTHPAVNAHLGRVTEQDVQRYFRAADAVLLPYTSIVNSGVLLLGSTWGVPAVATGQGEVGALVDQTGIGVTYDPDGGPDALADAVEQTLDGDRDAMRGAALGLSEELRPDVIAEQYARKVVLPALGR